MKRGCLETGIILRCFGKDRKEELIEKTHDRNKTKRERDKVFTLWEVVVIR